jgi:hypothetical protein
MDGVLVYHPEVKTKDVPKLNRDVAKRIQRAVENRLAVGFTNPKINSVLRVYAM